MVLYSNILNNALKLGEMMKWLFKIVKFFVRVVYPKMEIVGTDNLPDGPCVIVGNHSQLHGPIACELYFDKNCYTWCAGQMMHIKDVPAYAFEDFWSQKPKRSYWYYKLCSYLIAPLSVLVFNNARTIGVYHDNRILSTFRTTVKMLEQGNNIIIFPEYDKKRNNIVYEFQSNFISIAKLYRKRTGKELKFVPMYIAPRLKKIYLGEPVSYNSQQNSDDECKRICDYLMEEVTGIARSLPEHTVVPYRNIPKKLYPTNIEKREER